MKTLIEIPDNNIIENTESCFGIRFDGLNLRNIIMSGERILNNATNGDVIKAMFPNYHVQVSTELEMVEVYYDGTEEYTGSWFRFDLNWWNAPYKQEV